MNLFRALFAALARLFTFQADVSAHQRDQAYGPRWSLHRRRRIESYRRRRSRRWGGQRPRQHAFRRR